METRKQTHPSYPQLAALVLGKGDSQSRARLQQHVDGCDSCAKFIAETPRQQLIALLRRPGGAASISDQSTPGVRSGTFSTRTHGSKSQGPGGPQTTGGFNDQASVSGMRNQQLHEDEIPAALRTQSKYRIESLLGRGGMGSVYAAYHERMDRAVAIKVINPGLVDHPDALQRFDQEVKAAAKLDHPNVARAYDADEFDTLRVLVMEYVPGQSLDRFLATRGRLSVVEACRLIRQAMVGLDHAHARGMVHRDLKPQNLMLTPQGKVKILDFGLAKIASEQQGGKALTRDNAMMGTPHYLAPEQALDAAKADIRADIYSLGCTLYCLLAGSPPFDGDTEMKVLLAHQNDVPPPLCEICPDVPRELSALVDRMLAKHPADRPQTPKEVAEALLPFAKGEIPASAAKPVDPFAFLAQPTPAGDTIVKATSSTGPTPKSRRVRFGTVGGAIALLGLFFGAWAAGMFTAHTPEGTIIVDNVPADVDVQVEGSTVTLSRKGEMVTITAVSTGEHHLKFVRDGKIVRASDAKIDVGGDEIHVNYAGLSSSRESSSTPESTQQQAESKTDTNVPSAHFQSGSVWSGTKSFGNGAFEGTVVDYHLHVRERTNGTFVGHKFNNGSNRNRAEVTGTIRGNQIQWQEKHDTGTAQVLGVFKEDGKTIHLTFTNAWQNRATAKGTGELKLVSSKDAIAPPSTTLPEPSTQADSSEASKQRNNSDLNDEPKWGAKSSNVSIQGGNWKIVRGDDGDELVQSSTAEETTGIAFGDPTWSHYNLSFKGKVDAGNNGFAVAWNISDQFDFRVLRLGWLANSQHQLSQFTAGRPNDAGMVALPGSIDQNRWYDIRIEVRGAACRCYIDGVHVPDFDKSVSQLSSGRVGFGGFATAMRFKDVWITTEDGKLLWIGLPTPPDQPSGSASELPAPKSPPTSSAFFNGQNLTGWRGLKAYWDVKEGAIVGVPPQGSSATTFLYSDQTYKDFRLAFKVRLKGDVGNSGVQIRSWLNDSTYCKLLGPQIEIAPAGADRYLTGSLLTEPVGEPAIRANPAAAQAWKKNEFNAITIDCIGKHAKVTINGTVAVDADFPSMPDEGHIAWQLHGKKPPEELAIKDIEFTDLSSVPTPKSNVDLSTVEMLKDPREWSVSNPALVTRTATGHVISAGDEDTYVMTKRSSFSDFNIRATLQAAPGTEAWILLRAIDKNGKWNGITSRIFDVGNSLQTGMQFHSFNLNEHGMGYASVPFSTPFDLTFQMKKKTLWIRVNDKSTSGVSYSRHWEQSDGAVGLLVTKGSLEVHSFSIEGFGDAMRQPLTPVTSGKDGGSTSIFNGRDLTGWRRLPAYWSVDDGVIVGKPPAGSSANTFLCSEEPYKDFELQFQIRLKDDVGNCGVQIRSPPADLVTLEMAGPQVEIAPASSEKYLTGSIVMEPDASQRIAANRFKSTRAWKKNEFNAITIRCVGKHVTTVLNGTVLVDEDFKSLPDEGCIGWQLHGKRPPEEVAIKDIQLTEIKSSARPASAKAFKGSYYQYFPQKVSWHDARDRCTALGGRLAFVTNEAQNQFLTSLILDGGGKSSWLGATDEKVEGQWLWSDGSKMAYAAWDTSAKQPNNKQRGEHYLVLRADRNGQWSDQPSFSSQINPGFICQWD